MLLNYTQKTCFYCNSTEIQIIQMRKNYGGLKPIYYCKTCKKKFTPDDGFKKFRHSPIIIKTAIQLLEKGSSLSQITNYLNSNFRVKVSRKTILDWKKRFLDKKENSKKIVSPFTLR